MCGQHGTSQGVPPQYSRPACLKSKGKSDTSNHLSEFCFMHKRFNSTGYHENNITENCQENELQIFENQVEENIQVELILSLRSRNIIVLIVMHTT